MTAELITPMPTYEPAATRAAIGIVSTQAPRMLPATPQRTARRPFDAPAPMMDPVIVCVVEIGASKA